MGQFRRVLLSYILASLVAFAVACGGESQAPGWDVLASDEPGALLSVWGASADDVWIVGADARDGTGPTVLRVRGEQIERLETGESAGDLWWVFGFPAGPIFMGGDGGTILRYQDGNFTKMATPGNKTVFGIWGSSPDDMWAVGGASASSGGFVWRLDGDTWVDEPQLPEGLASGGALWKVNGTASDNLWIVGSNGLNFFWDGESLEAVDTGVATSLFTVFGAADRYAAVGGEVTGVILENEGGDWIDVTPELTTESLTGVSLDDHGGGIAVGFFGTVVERFKDGWQSVDLGFYLGENLHGVWMDPTGGVWVAGGNTLGYPLTSGILLHRAAK